MQKSNSEILIYQSPNGNIEIDVRLEEENVWLTQKLMAELFQVKPQNITMHLKNIYEEGELDEKATCKDYLQVQTEGNREVNRKQKFYNLDAIISVGYRIKSQVATQFRIWATQRLKEYIVKGFALNDERFKTGISMNYYNELQERLREIRLSERFFYQKIKDIYLGSDFHYHVGQQQYLKWSRNGAHPLKGNERPDTMDNDGFCYLYQYEDCLHSLLFYIQGYICQQKLLDF